MNQNARGLRDERSPVARATGPAGLGRFRVGIACLRQKAEPSLTLMSGPVCVARGRLLRSLRVTARAQRSGYRAAQYRDRQAVLGPAWFPDAQAAAFLSSTGGGVRVEATRPSRCCRHRDAAPRSRTGEAHGAND